MRIAILSMEDELELMELIDEEENDDGSTSKSGKENSS